LPAGPAHRHDAADVAGLPAGGGAPGRFVALAGTGLALVAAASVVLGRRQRRRLAALLGLRGDDRFRGDDRVSGLRRPGR
jgi:hypothetical protein